MLSLSKESTTTLLIVAGMLMSGVCNTILNKYQDMQCVEHCDDPDPTKRRYFEQPVWQTVNMFIGEAAVWVIYALQVLERRRQRLQSAYEEIPPSAVDHLDAIVKHPHREALTGRKSFLLWIPTLCDMTATTVMSVGLLFTSASVYQMLRGSVVIFTGLFSYLFLGRKLRRFEWFSLAMVVGGVAIVGLSSLIVPQNKPSGSNSAGNVTFDLMSLLGVILVLGAQLFTASQFVIEEKIMTHYHITPLKAVGFEGTFGLVSVLAAMPVLHLLLSKQSIYFDLSIGFHDVFDTPGVWKTGIFIALSIAFFNWTGLTITSRISATARSTIDACRTLFIWMVSLYLGWEKFTYVQLIGFIIMVTGTFIFNGVIRLPFDRLSAEESAPLLRPATPEEDRHD
ncbi:hypothetical protein BX666DRAFT_2032683 [Dichotomocladium elegans]|nr:hypothetical protein BX666DRAFT_2032683 [Dichotomocladium elegans]